MAESSKNPNSKHEALSNDGSDRISKLPESLLYHILSFLTTKESAKTCVLSKQWQYLWTCVPVLNVNAKDMRTRDKNFEQIVFKVLLSMRELQCLKKVRFSCDNQCDYVTLGYLLCALVARDLEEFCLNIDHNPIGFELPRSLLSCKTLVVLKLKGPIAISVSSSSLEFPRLEVLHLNNVTFKGDGSVPNLLLSCPVLHDLVVSNVYKSSGKFTVKSPALEHLTYQESSSGSLAFENLGELTQATVEFSGATTIEHWEAVLRVIKAARTVRLLGLKLFVVMKQGPNPLAVHRTHLCDHFPELNNLEELKLEIDCYSVLGLLLYKLPLLKNLTIAKARSGSGSGHSCGVSTCPSSPPSQDVPNCLSSNLMEFTILGFEGLDVEVEFIGYILKHSVALQDVSFSTPSSDEKKMFPTLKKLLMFERASSRCRLNFVTFT